jgi:hypothetical protein
MKDLQTAEARKFKNSNKSSGDKILTGKYSKR